MLQGAVETERLPPRLANAIGENALAALLRLTVETFNCAIALRNLWLTAQPNIIAANRATAIPSTFSKRNFMTLPSMR